MKIVTLLLAFCLSLSVLASTIEVEVSGMTCGMCVEAITKELKATEKAESINVSLESKKTTFVETKGKKMSDGEIRAAIKKAGYDAGKIIRK